MCGICGYLGGASPHNEDEIIGDMVSALRRRGPNDQGAWRDAEAGVALGHTRLAILDLSPLGHQPMASPSGRFIMTFNGEIYNFRELRRLLEALGYAFRGGSDTEIMLAAFEAWGVVESLKRFNGMFAFAVWDSAERRLTLARDRMGEKPLYYGVMKGRLLFGSELKALQRHPLFVNEVNRDALALFFRFNYIPSPYAIFANVWKLPPGTYLSVKLVQHNQIEQLDAPHKYWSLREVQQEGAAQPYRQSFADAEYALEGLLRDAIQLRMISDVPLGAFLSGGTDSSLIVAIMQSLSDVPVRTFSIGFHESDYDESRYASRVAKYLGTQHTEVHVTWKDALETIPKLPVLYDEPFADSSQIPTYLLSAVTRRHVSVALSGDGGDELFLGYKRYQWAAQILRLHSSIPLLTRMTLSKLASMPAGFWRAFASVTSAFGLLPAGRLAHRLRRFTAMLSAGNSRRLYEQLVSHWDAPLDLVIGSRPAAAPFYEDESWADPRGIMRQCMYVDQRTYLPDDILVKVDRASMSVALETRVPLLDHRIVEFGMQLPTSFLSNGGAEKRILKRILHRYIPRHLVDRPKMGFGVPIEYWLKKELRDWAEELLRPQRLEQEGFLRSECITKKWDQFVAGKGSWDQLLWDVLMFQAWQEEMLH